MDSNKLPDNAVLYPPPRSPSGLQGQSDQSEDSPRTVLGKSDQSEESPTSPKTVRRQSEDSPRTVRALFLNIIADSARTLLGLC